MVIEGDAPPTEQDASELFASVAPAAAAPAIQLDAYQRAKIDGVPDPYANTGDFIGAVASDPAGFAKSLPGGALAPFGVAGAILNAGAQDVGAVIGGNPEGFGNVAQLFNQNPANATPLPSETTLRDISGSHPVTATLGKIAAGTVQTLPMMAAGMPGGALGRLIGLGFAADMTSHGSTAAGVLAGEMDKQPEARDPDVVTSAVAELVQAGLFAPLAAAHAGGVLPVRAGERAPDAQAKVIGDLATQLLNDPVIYPAERPAPLPISREADLSNRPDFPFAKDLQTPAGEPVPAPVEALVKPVVPVNETHAAQLKYAAMPDSDRLELQHLLAGHSQRPAHPEAYLRNTGQPYPYPNYERLLELQRKYGWEPLSAEEVADAKRDADLSNIPAQPVQSPQPPASEPTKNVPAANESAVVPPEQSSLSFDPAVVQARVAWLDNLKPYENGQSADATAARWEAIQNTYETAKAAQAALPGVPLKDVFGLTIKKGGYPSSPTVDHFFVERSKLNELARSLNKQYPPGKYSQQVQPGSEPYSPRKGEPSFKEWLQGKRPATVGVKPEQPTALPKRLQSFTPGENYSLEDMAAVKDPLFQFQIAHAVANNGLIAQKFREQAAAAANRLLDEHLQVREYYRKNLATDQPPAPPRDVSADMADFLKRQLAERLAKGAKPDSLVVQQLHQKIAELEPPAPVGNIPAEAASAIGSPSAPIRLMPVDAAHINTPARLAQIKEFGYANGEALVADVAANFQSIYQGKGKSLILAKVNDKAKIAYVELESDGSFYRVKSALVSRPDYLKNKKRLWERAQTNQPTPASQPPSAVTGQSQSNKPSAGGEVKAPSLGKLSQELLDIGRAFGLTRPQVIRRVTDLANRHGLRDWKDTRNAEDYYALIEALQADLQKREPKFETPDSAERRENTTTTPQPFKAGDKVLHEGQIKTVSKAVPGSEYLGIGGRAVHVSKVQPAPEIKTAANVDTTADIAKAERSGKVDAFDPAAAREQKKFLLDAVDEAIADAPKALPKVPADVDVDLFETVRQFKAGETEADFNSRRAQVLNGLAVKYGVEVKAPEVTKIEAEQIEAKILKARYDQRPKVTIEIPGDGTFDILHSKAKLEDFKERAAKFPTSSGKPSAPGRARETPKAVPALGKVNTDNTIKALRDVVSDDATRKLIQHIWTNGKISVATNGRMLTIIKHGLGGTEAKPKIVSVAGKEIKLGKDEKYPPWQQVVPEEFKDKLAGVDVARLHSVLTQAAEATTEQARGVALWRNKDDSYGITAKSGEMEYNHNGWHESKLIGMFDPIYLHAALKAARAVGDEKVTLRWTDDRSPLSVESEHAQSVIMPMRSTNGPVRPPQPVSNAEKAAKVTSRNKGKVASPPLLAPGGDVGEPAPVRGSAGALPPADDHSFSTFAAMPMEMPEAVRMVKALTGVYPKVREYLGDAAGLFRYTQGEHGKGHVEILARQFDLLTRSEKEKLWEQAKEYAKATAGAGDNAARIARERYKFTLDEAYQAAKTRNPVAALKTMWHEIGHVVDWLPDHIIRGRGNLFGRLASLKKFSQHVLPFDPAYSSGKPISATDRANLRAAAEKALRDELGPIQETVRKIIVEEPEWKIVGVTAEDVQNILREGAGKDTPELTRWFAEQPSKVKAEVLRKAMRGLIDERLAALGKKVQTGVRRTERTVREKVGREPTQQEIKQRFAELLAKEIKARNLADLETVKAELSGLIAWWRGTPTIPDYFKTSWEMYADAFSVWANNPAAALKRAPTYSEMMWNYLDRKPEVKALYDEIQRQIKSGEIMGERVKSLMEMWDGDDARSLAIGKESRQTSKRDFYDNVVYHFDRRFGPIYRSAHGSRHEGKVKEAIGTFLYRATEHERFLAALNNAVGKKLVQHDLDWSHDLGEYLYHKRVIEERFNLANPLGFTPKNSLERLAEIQGNLGPERWSALETAAKEYRQLYEEHVVKEVVESRMFTPELNDILLSRAHYATFAAVRDVADTGIERILDTRFSVGMTPHIYRQIGNLGEIKNPATATVLKGLSLISAAYRNTMKREVVRLLKEQDPENIIPAKTRWNGKALEPVIVDNHPQIGTVVFMQNGKPQAFYVRRVVSDAVNASSPTENKILSQMVQVNGWMKGLFTQLNYAFWPVNMVRDTAGFLMQMPGNPLPTYLKNFPKALAAARQSVTHAKPNEYADEALRRKLVISQADPRGVWAAADNEFDLKVASYGMEPAQWAKEEGKVHALVKAWNYYRELGQTIERVNKISGMLYLDEKFPAMPEWKKREVIRERSGSPNFLERGASNPAIDAVFLFYNPWKEGIRSLTKSARENPFSFAAKATVGILLPTTLQAAAVNGWLGDDRKKQYQSIPDYDLTNYLCVPLGWADEKQGKVTYLRLPLWEPARIAHGMLFQTLTNRGAGILSHAGGQLPGLNPIWQVGLAWGEYAMGKNPVDLSRAVNVLPKTTYEAGGTAALAEMGKYTWNSLGGSIITRFKNLNLESPPETVGEKFMALPVVNNALGRWVKVSDRGLADADRALTAPIEQKRALVRLAVRPIADKLLNHEALTTSEKVLMREPYAQSYLHEILPDLAKSRANLEFRRMNGALDKESKAAIAQELRK